MPRILKRVWRLKRKAPISGRLDGQVTPWQMQGPINHPQPSKLPGFYGPWGPGHFPEHHSEFIDSCHYPSQLFYLVALEGSLVLMPSQENAARSIFSPQLVGGRGAVRPAGVSTAARYLLYLLGEDQGVTIRSPSHGSSPLHRGPRAD